MLTSIGPLVPLTKEEWGKMNGKQQWDTIVALRGPDVRGSENIKWVTTSVIRGKMSGIMRVGGQVNQDLNLILLPAGWNLVTTYPPRWQGSVPAEMDDFHRFLEKSTSWYSKQPKWASEHFFQHTAEAAETIGIPTAIIPVEIWLLATEQGTKKMLKAFLTYLKSIKDTKGGGLAGAAGCVEELERHIKTFEKAGLGE